MDKRNLLFMQMLNIIVLVFVLAITGCATNFSGVKGYREYVRKEITLLNPVYLIEAQSDIPRSSRYLNPHYINIPPGTLYLMVDAASAQSQGIELPRGTALYIREIVCQTTSGSSLEVQARGTVFVEELNRQVNFLYIYTYEDLCVRRAPWEGEPLPLWRKFYTSEVEWCKNKS